MRLPNTLLSRAITLGLAAVLGNVIVPPCPAADRAYLMSYFVGDSVAENRLHLCWSSDGLHWAALNNDNPVVISSMSTKAIRDPAILRKQDGTYVLMYTDSAWSVGQKPTCGFWDSRDLVNWRNQRICTLSSNSGVPAWGPEAIYDPVSGKYIVLWSTASSDSIWYNTTADFVTFSKEAPFFSPGYQVLENNIYHYGGLYYLFFKDERGGNIATTPYKALKVARSSSLTPGSFKIITDDYITPHLAEGPVICKALDAERWYLYFDMFTQGGIFKCSTTTNLNSNTSGWSALSDNQFALPKRVRNGHIFEIDRNELNTLRNVWDNGPNFAQGCAASASSELGGNPASNANDVNYNTFWSATAGNGENEWLEINLGTNRTFNKTVIRQTNSDRITGYKIQYHNGNAWADAYTGGTMGTNVKIDTFPPVTAARVRLLVTAVQSGAPDIAPEPISPTGSSSCPQINEFDIYNSARVGSADGQGAEVVPVRGVYRGWDAVCLSNRYVSLQIVPIIGGRVMEYALGNKNFMWVNPGLAGKTPPPGGVGPENAWLNYGGDKLWPAPQGWDNAEQWPGPPDAVLDGGPYRVELLPEDGAGAGVRLTSGEDKRSGIQFSRVIRLHEGSTHVSFEASMKNNDTKPRRWGLWSHCQLDAAKPGGGHNAKMNAYCPINPKSQFTNGYTVIFGDEMNPSFQADAKRGLMRVQYQYKVGKIGLDSPAGWVATVCGSAGWVFVQRATFEPGKEYPDGSSVEFWLNGTGSFRAWGKDNVMSGDPEKNPYVFESEVLSPFAKLQPGESYAWKYDWYAANLGGDFPVLDCSDAGVTAEPLKAHAEGPKAHLTGRFGVFAPGTLRVEFVDVHGALLATHELPLMASPLQPLVIDTRVASPKTAASVKLQWIGTNGTTCGQLAMAVLNR